MKNRYTVFIVLLLVFQITSNLFSKNSFDEKNNNEQAGHADDIAKLLTGNGYWVNNGNQQLLTTLKSLTYIMYLVVDSTMRMEDENQAYEVDNAITYLRENMKQLNFDSISNFREFLTPAGNTHGHYTHLGWDHIYPDDDIISTSRGDIIINTQKRWGIRKKILTEALGKMFSFSIFNSAKQDSLGALFYYVHILGDHEDNSITTAYTRIPIESKYEQMFKIGFPGWETSDQRWVPNENETIIKELKKHLERLFSDQINTPNGLYYSNLIRGLDGILPENQIEKARYVLNLLFNNVPSLLKGSSFARDFYKKHHIIVNTYIPYFEIISVEDDAVFIKNE